MNNKTEQRREVVFEGHQQDYLKRNWFDLSHQHLTTFKMGWLVPFLTLETLPGDTFKISNETMVRFQPLILPLMTRVEISTWYFYVPNRIQWPDWENFITTYDTTLVWPHTVIQNHTLNDGQLCEYMGVPIGNTGSVGCNVKLNVFPISAYFMIYDEYFHPGVEFQPLWWQELVQGDNSYYYLLAKDIPLLRMWNYDYLTANLPEAQYYVEMLIPMYDMQISQYLYPQDTALAGPFRLREEVTGNIAPLGSVQIANTGGGNRLSVNTGGGSGPNVYIDNQENAASISEFRYAAQLQSYLERVNRSGRKYSDFMLALWGSDPHAGVINQPVYLGGSRGRVMVSEVMSTADTTALPVGGYAGQAISIDSSRTIEYTTKEHGFIIGLINIQPRSSYYWGMPRFFKWRREPLEYATPEFEGIGDQQTYDGEVFFDWTVVEGASNVNFSEWGYNPRYSEYRYNQDVISGQMRDVVSEFHLARDFSAGLPALSYDFLTCAPDVTRVFNMAATDHECLANIWNNVKVHRALSMYGNPHM